MEERKINISEEEIDQAVETTLTEANEEGVLVNVACSGPN